MASAASLREIAGCFLRLGTVAFGGPAAHVAMMEDEFVQRREWLSREKFLDLLGASNLIPGPSSSELAIHIGYHVALLESVLFRLRSGANRGDGVGVQIGSRGDDRQPIRFAFRKGHTGFGRGFEDNPVPSVIKEYMIAAKDALADRTGEVRARVSALDIDRHIDGNRSLDQLSQRQSVDMAANIVLRKELIFQARGTVHKRISLCQVHQIIRFDEWRRQRHGLSRSEVNHEERRDISLRACGNQAIGKGIPPSKTTGTV